MCPVLIFSWLIEPVGLTGVLPHFEIYSNSSNYSNFHIIATYFIKSNQRVQSLTFHRDFYEGGKASTLETKASAVPWWLVLTLVGWMSGRGSRDSGMNTTRISFLALHSFLNRSILAAASSLMGDPELWVGARPQLSGTEGVEKTRGGRRVKSREGEPGTNFQRRKEERKEEDGRTEGEGGQRSPASALWVSPVRSLRTGNGGRGGRWEDQTVSQIQISLPRARPSCRARRVQDPLFLLLLLFFWLLSATSGEDGAAFIGADKVC